LILVTTRLVTVSLTVLFVGMRAVMDIGGSCGSGGPSEIAHPCPGNVGALMPAAIWGGLIFAGLYVLVTMKYRVPAGSRCSGRRSSSRSPTTSSTTACAAEASTAAGSFAESSSA
jgi:hypothetical protein